MLPLEKNLQFENIDPLHLIKAKYDNKYKDYVFSRLFKCLKMSICYSF